MDTLAGQGVEISRQGSDQRFTFAGGHLGDFPLVQHHPAHKLNVEMNHVPFGFLAYYRPASADMAATGFLDDSEGLDHQIIGCFTVGESLAEFIGLGTQLVIAEGFQRGIHLIGGLDKGSEALLFTLVLGAENLCDHIHHNTDTASCCSPTPQPYVIKATNAMLPRQPRVHRGFSFVAR
jgi:hypothetical protein